MSNQGWIYNLLWYFLVGVWSNCWNWLRTWGLRSVSRKWDLSKWSYVVCGRQPKPSIQYFVDLSPTKDVNRQDWWKRVNIHGVKAKSSMGKTVGVAMVRTIVISLSTGSPIGYLITWICGPQDLWVIRCIRLRWLNVQSGHAKRSRSWICDYTYFENSVPAMSKSLYPWE